jgi:hypothetical protein
MLEHAPPFVRKKFFYRTDRGTTLWATAPVRTGLTYCAGRVMTILSEPTSLAGRLPGRIQARTRGRCHRPALARWVPVVRAAPAGCELLESS